MYSGRNFRCENGGQNLLDELWFCIYCDGCSRADENAEGAAVNYVARPLLAAGSLQRISNDEYSFKLKKTVTGWILG